MPIDDQDCVEVVTAVLVSHPYTLEVTFEDGMIRRVDVEPTLSKGIFIELRDPALFAQVTVDADAGTVVWPNGADLAPEFLYESGAGIAP